MGQPRWNVRTSVDKIKCVICAEAVGYVRLTPEQCYEALCAPEGANIFRVERRIPRGGSGRAGDPQLEDVTFVAPMRVLFWKKWARTTVRQAADFTHSDTAVSVGFELLHSDLMSKLEGAWTFTLERPASSCKDLSDGSASDWPLSRIQYSFRMWPKGVPTALRRLPGLVDAVQAALARESMQMLDKLAFIESKMVHPSMPILSALRVASDEVARAGSYKKMTKRLAAATTNAPAAATSASGAAGSQSGGDASMKRGTALARPQVIVTAHRLSCASSAGSLESLDDDDELCSDDCSGHFGDYAESLPTHGSSVCGCSSRAGSAGGSSIPGSELASPSSDGPASKPVCFDSSAATRRKAAAAARHRDGSVCQAEFTGDVFACVSDGEEDEDEKDCHHSGAGSYSSSGGGNADTPRSASRHRRVLRRVTEDDATGRGAARMLEVAALLRSASIAAPVLESHQ